MLSDIKGAKQTKRYLDSWKEIAVFLNRSVRTVQRWEREEHLPVHRHQHRKRGSVFAFPSEITTWLETRDGPSLVRDGLETTSGTMDSSDLAMTSYVARRRC